MLISDIVSYSSYSVAKSCENPLGARTGLPPFRRAARQPNQRRHPNPPAHPPHPCDGANRGKRLSPTELGLNPRLAVGLPPKTIDHQQTKAGALADGLGGEKRIERRSISSAPCHCRYRSPQAPHSFRRKKAGGVTRHYAKRNLLKPQI